MVRSIIGLFVGAVALCAYIIFQQDAPRSASAFPPVVPSQGDVARAASQPLLAEGLTDTFDATARTAPVTVTPAPMPALIPAPLSEPEPVPTIKTDDSTVAMTTANILAGLGVKIDIASIREDAALETTDVLASIGIISGGIHSEPAPRTELELLVVESLQLGLSDAAIDRRVNEAALAGELTVPEILVTSQGRVDTSVLLEDIVTTARIAAGGAKPAVPEVPVGEGTGVEVRVVQRATETQQYRFYTVASGDSLGRISAKFYGDVKKYTVIFEANRNLLSSPDQIKVGQRLTIPDLPEV